MRLPRRWSYSCSRPGFSRRRNHRGRSAPAEFLARTAQAADFLWLWTVFCAEPEADIVEGDFRGRFLGELVEHPLAGADRQSFLPTISSLTDMLWAAGFSEISLLNKALTPNNNGPAILLKAEKKS